ncbi:precorrin-3B synthase [Algihabitans albus]|uniref:precorrin-3B synthase n=1 Tax=Algihabitans albus TaxID=2164067 RepID=UPI000E5C8685|nr:precorrin-3B synthase [Algihabitans albus]
MIRPVGKGHCPGAYNPMDSGDGLLVRVRPHLGHLEAKQAFGLAEAARRHGNGVIDLTSRANLQIRGVRAASHPALLRDLDGLGLLDAHPMLESRRNLVVTPLWRDGDETLRIAEALTARLPELPDLPPKFGFAVDAGLRPLLSGVSADIRVERAAGGPDAGLVVRADGAPQGQLVGLERAVPAIIALARWFADSGGAEAGRMARHLRHRRLPDGLAQRSAAPPAPPLEPGSLQLAAGGLGFAYGVPFGQIPAAALDKLLQRSGAAALRVTPWRVLLLEAARPVQVAPFIERSGDPLMTVDACPGAPACASATVDTRALAQSLAAEWGSSRAGRRLHVSGCAKGCARPRSAAVTLVGRDGAFDLVRDGCAWDAPEERGLTPGSLLERHGVL